MRRKTTAITASPRGWLCDGDGIRLADGFERLGDLLLVGAAGEQGLGLAGAAGEDQQSASMKSAMMRTKKTPMPAAQSPCGIASGVRMTLMSVALNSMDSSTSVQAP